jgi:hypothetical protein
VWALPERGEGKGFERAEASGFTTFDELLLVWFHTSISS